MRRLKQENEKLRMENRRLRQEVETEHNRYIKWKSVAELFHNELWKVLLKYDPDTYRVMYQNREKAAGTPDIEISPKLEVNE